MVNEEIAGGIESALLRGQSMKQAMISFYNAGYKKKDIEEAARFVNENGPMPVQPQTEQPKKINHQKKSKEKTFEKNHKQIPSKENLIKHFETKTLQPSEKKFLEKHGEKVTKLQKHPPKKLKQSVSEYGPSKDKEMSKLRHMLAKTMRALQKQKVSPTKVIYEKQPPKYSNNVSNYGVGPQMSKPAGKTIIVLLAILLIILLGALGTLFFFKSEVIEFFNRFGIS